MIIKKQNREQEQLRKKLKPGLELHSQVLQYVRDCFDLSAKTVGQRYEKWRQSENLQYAYVDPNERDSAGKKLYPFNRSIVVPYTYAILQTRLTYFFLALASKSPIIPIEGRGPKDIVPAKMMEIVNDYQISETSGPAVFYNWIQDSERYGVGIVKNVYRKLQEDRYFIKREPVSIFGLKAFDRKIVERKLTTLYEGNILVNITPFKFYHDPRVNICKLHDGEFAGYLTERSYNYLLNREREGEYFNIKHLKNNTPAIAQYGDKESEFGTNNSQLSNIVGVSPVLPGQTVDAKDSGYPVLKELYCQIIPKDRHLGDNSYPEIWIMTIADDKIVIKCEPAEEREFPFYAIESNHDYAAPFNLGMPEMLKGLQDILSWLFNSHIDNVQKILNDVLVVNPYYVNVNDLFTNEPVKIITLREQGYMLPGGIDSVIKQLQVNDITRGHIQDANTIMTLMQRVSAATDNVMGMVEEVKRTATETSSTINLATSRLKMTVKLMCALGIIPMTRSMSFNNQEQLTEELYYNITSDLAKQLGQDPRVIEKRILIGAEELYGNFNFKYPSADLPVDKIQTAGVWQAMLREVAANQVLMQKFDMVPIFSNWLVNMGITNVSDFMIQPPEIREDEVVSKEIDKGNLVSASEVMKNMDITGMIGDLLGGKPGSTNGVPNVADRERML